MPYPVHLLFTAGFHKRLWVYFETKFIFSNYLKCLAVTKSLVLKIRIRWTLLCPNLKSQLDVQCRVSFTPPPSPHGMGVLGGLVRVPFPPLSLFSISSTFLFIFFIFFCVNSQQFLFPLGIFRIILYGRSGGGGCEGGGIFGALCLGMNPRGLERPRSAAYPRYDVLRALNFAWL